MSRNQRIGLVVAALVVAAVAFVIARPGGDGGDDNGGASTTAAKQSSGSGSSTAAAAAPAVSRIQIKGGEVVGGVKNIKVTKGDSVRIVVSADAQDDIHLHGYDIEKPVEPGRPAVFRFKANLEGVFEIESHVAEHEGREPKLAQLTVEPS